MAITYEWSFPNFEVNSSNEAKTMITVEAKWQHLEAEGYLPFLATPDDPEAHGRDLLERCKNGEFGTVADYVAPEEGGE
jgi:hypothetical protein